MSHRLRILTANLLNDAADPEVLAERLHAHRVDVCAVQELGPAQARAIADVLPHGKLEPATDHSGMGIALRQPGDISSLPLEARSAHVAHLDPAGWPQLSGAVEVMNLHVRAPHISPIWRTLAIRRAQLRGLLAHLDRHPHPGRVVVGDFNASPAWPLYRRMAARLRDAAHEHHRRRGSRAPRTWGPHPRGPRLFRIDHAFVERLEVSHSEVVSIPGSDHSALLVELETGEVSEGS